MKKKKLFWEQAWGLMNTEEKALELIESEIVKKYQDLASSGHREIFEANHLKFTQ